MKQTQNEQKGEAQEWKLNKDLMKKDVQITTKVLEVRRDEMKVRTVPIVIRENGLRSRHTEVKWCTFRALGRGERSGTQPAYGICEGMA